jgi:quercetin dioxygenase-like cupin family protein
MEEIMKNRRLIALVTCLAFAVLAGIGAVTAQAQNDRVQVMMSEIGLPGYVNTIKATVQPGQKSNPHSHAGRISIQIILEGTAIEHRNDQVLTHNTGEFYYVPEGSSHWLENKGTVPMSYVEVNIRPTGPEPAAPAAQPNKP